MSNRLIQFFKTPVRDLSAETKILIGSLLIGFLAWVFWPSCLTCSTRPLRFRLRADMRTLESAIESYATDHGAYPPSTFDKNFQLNWQYSEDGSTFDRRVLLSTPIPYILSYPTDFLFSEEEPQSNFGYWTNGDLFIIYSPSPDKKIDLDMREFENIFNRENAILAPSTQTLLTTSALQYLETHAFDPSNGSESSGDIFYNSALFK